MSTRNHLTPVDGGRASNSDTVLTETHSGPSTELAEIRWPTADETLALYRRARQLQAQALGELLSVFGRSIAESVRRLASGTVSFLVATGQAVAAMRTYEELSRLSDHELADIGLTRDDVPIVAFRHLRSDEAGLTPRERASDELVEQNVRKAA